VVISIFGIAWALIVDVGHIVRVVVEIGAAIGVLEAIEIFGVVRAAIVRDTVVIRIRRAHVRAAEQQHEGCTEHVGTLTYAHGAP
jgi:hypothetical protein